MPRCEQVEVKSDELRLCHAVFAIKVSDWGIITRQRFSLRDPRRAGDSAELYFSYSFHGTFDLGALFPPRGVKSVLFFNAPLPLLFCRHEGGFVLAAFGILLQCVLHHSIYFSFFSALK